MNLPIETIAIGDELLTGVISDTNSTFIGKELLRLGLCLSRNTVIPDNPDTIQETLRQRSQSAHLIFVFGGLGPTSDDRTVEAVCDLVGCVATMDEDARSTIETAYRQRAQPLNAHALRQAHYPSAATPLKNPVGMAPGFRLTINQAECFFLPGVPVEMMEIFRTAVSPWLKSYKGGQTHAPLQTRLWKCIAIAESALQLKMDAIQSQLHCDAWLGYQTDFPENHLTLYYRGEDDRYLTQLVEAISDILRPWCFTQSDETIESIVFRKLQAKKFRIAIAESCTAGLVTHRLARIPGASHILWGGVTAYSLEAKAKLLGVSFDSLDGATSQESSRQLATNTRKLSGVELCAAITGYMGPDPGTTDKPAGTIFCTVIDDQGNFLDRKILLSAKNRERTQWAAATHLLELIRQSIA